MPRFDLMVLVAGVTLMTASTARAQLFHDDDDGWCLFCFHRYGGDVNRPGATPDRPYWHGDDAVPLGMRWQDVEAARAGFAVEDAAVAAVAPVATPPAPVVPRRITPRRHAHAASRRCVPVLVRKD